jgi:hypothetical protein
MITNGQILWQGEIMTGLPLEILRAGTGGYWAEKDRQSPRYPKSFDPGQFIHTMSAGFSGS